MVHCLNAVKQTSGLYKGGFACPHPRSPQAGPQPLVMRALLTAIWVVTLFFAVLHPASTAYAALVNVTIDDTNGDSVTGLLPSYVASEDDWNRQSGCSGCWSHLDTSSVFDGTWHSATFDAGHATAKAVNISFTGNLSAVDFLCLLERSCHGVNAQEALSTHTSLSQINQSLGSHHRPTSLSYSTEAMSPSSCIFPTIRARNNGHIKSQYM